jgi:diguanylate cyclase
MKKTTQFFLLMTALLLFNIIYYLGRWGGDEVLQYVSDGLPMVCSFIAILYLYSAVKSFKVRDNARLAWLLILIGISLNFVAESLYAVLEIGYQMDMNETFPTVADVFWCLGYIPLFGGLVLMFMEYKKSGLPLGRPPVYTAIVSGALLIFFVLGYFLLKPILEDEETDPLAKFFYFYYPLADLMLVVPAAILMYITSLFGSSAISNSWRVMAIGFLCFAMADLLYAYLGWHDLYGNGNLIDVLWHAGYLLIGLSGLYQKELIESINTTDR